MEKLRPTLSLFDAVNIALGAIIGAGIFVILGAAAKVSGPAIFLSIIVAAVVAGLTGIASAELSKRFPKSGGAYTFAKEEISPFAGFLTGWVWLFSNIVAGATVAVGFGYYLAFFFPGVPTSAGAALVIAAVTGINLLGAKESSRVNNLLVAFKILVLLFFIGTAFFFFKSANFEPLAPFGIGGILAGAATIFFAFAGFARVAVIADEIKEPEKNVPTATLVSIVISTLIYIAVAVAAVGVAGYEKLANSGSPLADAMSSEGLPFGASIMAFGALVAITTVAISTVLGLSRLAFTMTGNGELPKFMGSLDKKGVPRNAVLLSGISMFAFAALSDLPHIAYISSFSLLLYYAAINLSGIRAFKGRTQYVALGGLLSCLVLLISLPALSWLVGVGALLAGAAYYHVFVNKANSRS
jgi:basic amino acid/polyamine antiporter, APA family